MVLSLRDTGRSQRAAGSPWPPLRGAFPLACVAVSIVTQLGRRVILAEWVDAPDIARVLRHLETDHAVTLGADACYVPACPVACELSGISEADHRPAIASSA